MRFLCLVLLSFIASTPSIARFWKEDADLIDQEERYNAETFNDIVSYLPPYRWEELWYSKDIGYQVSAGSLNATRFYFPERIKLQSHPEEPLSFAYSQERYEDTIEERLQREIRVSLKNDQGFRIGILADGNSDKKYGDLGVAVGYQKSGSQRAEAYIWSVDHYYNSKENLPEDRYEKVPLTYGFAYDWKFSEWLKSWAKWEMDLPLTWRRASKGYLYYREQKLFNLGLAYGLEEGLGADLKLKWESKSEKKAWTYSPTETYEKSYIRRHLQLDADIRYLSRDGFDWVGGVMLLIRKGQYGFRADTSIPSENIQENKSPDTERKEIGYYSTYLSRISLKHALQGGIHINHPTINDGTTVSSSQIKVQTAWEYSFTPDVRSFVDLSWDIDQLVDDFPFRAKPFKPWGGGHLALIAMF